MDALTANLLSGRYKDRKAGIHNGYVYSVPDTAMQALAAGYTVEQVMTMCVLWNPASNINDAWALAEIAKCSIAAKPGNVCARFGPVGELCSPHDGTQLSRDAALCYAITCVVAGHQQKKVMELREWWAKKVLRKRSGVSAAKLKEKQAEADDIMAGVGEDDSLYHVLHTLKVQADAINFKNQLASKFEG